MAVETSPNVIWITLDSIRHDHTSFGGYHRDTTPNLHEFARKNGDYFEGCFAHAHSSRPSVSSLFSGVYPSKHGNGFHNRIIPEQLTTAAERFSAAGYSTNCIVANPHVTPETRADQGVDHFEWVNKSTLTRPSEFTNTLKFLANIRRHSAGLRLDPKLHSTDYALYLKIKDRLKTLAHHEEPFYLYAHFQAAHRPYYPPIPHQSKFTDKIAMDKKEALATSVRISDNVYESMANGCDFDEREWDALAAMYDAEIAHSDVLTSKLLTYIDQLPLEDSIIVITADHGELLGERDLLGHGLILNDALLHVPLIISNAEFDIDTSGLVQHIDVMQTILSEIGADTDGMQGIDLRSNERNYVFAQRADSTYKSNMRLIRKHNPDFERPDILSGRVDCIRSREHKLETNGQEGRLYKLPDEENDVSDRYPEIIERLDEELNAFQRLVGPELHTQREETVSKARERQLRELGYLE